LIARNFGSRVPADVILVRQLPGVGRYTAGAIASFAFDLSEPVIDTNIGRALGRLTNCKLPVDTSAGRNHLWSVAKALLPKKGARDFNSALMELGALVCLPRKPRCGVCPVRRHCRADNPESLPRKRARPAVVRVTESHGWIRQGNDVLLEQSQARWRGMWTLPRLPTAPKHAPLLRLEFPFTHHRITLAVFSARRPLVPNDRQRWFAYRALADIPVPAPHRRALTQLLPILG
jgi:A/G-specific adenine glycosylase